MLLSNLATPSSILIVRQSYMHQVSVPFPLYDWVNETLKLKNCKNFRRGYMYISQGRILRVGGVRAADLGDPSLRGGDPTKNQKETH